MERNLYIWSLLLFLLSSSSSFAQSTAAVQEDSKTGLKELTNIDWSFFMDEERNVYFIDFETINVNLSDLVVKNEEGKIILKDELWKLPVDTIYELDFSHFDSGKYDVELRSFTGVLRKTVTIK